MAELHALMATISLLAAYVEKELGGSVKYIDDKESNGVILRWKKYDKASKKTLYFNHKISYIEIETMREPFAFGQKIVELYNQKREKKDG